MSDAYSLYSLETLDRICSFYEQQMHTLLTTKCTGSISTNHNNPPERGVRLEVTFRVRGTTVLANTGHEFTVLLSAFGNPGSERSLAMIKPYIPLESIITNARAGAGGKYEQYTVLACPFTVQTLCKLDTVNALEEQLHAYMSTKHTFLPLNKE